MPNNNKTAKTTVEKNIEKLTADLNALVERARSFIKQGKLAKLGETEDEIRKTEKDLAKMISFEVFAELLKTDDPIYNAIRLFAYNIPKHKMVREKGSTKIVDIAVESKSVVIDLLALCNYSKGKGKELSSEWQYTAAKVNQLLCLRVAQDLKCSPQEMDAICKTYFLKEEARKINLGGVPTSNNQLTKLLQKCIDEIVFKAGEDGKNTYKCNNHDVAFLLNAYARKDKKELFTITVSKDGYFRQVVMEVVKRIIENGRYGVNGYKTIKA